MKEISQISHKIFYKKDSRLFVVANDVLSIIIIVSLLVISLESVTQFSSYLYLFKIVEYTAVGIFTLEYLLRIIGSPKKSAYIFSFYGVIDFLAILPSFFGLINLTALKSLRALRVLRFLKIMRAAMIHDLGPRAKKDSAAIIKINLKIYFFAFFFAILVLGTMMYYFEPGNPSFSNIPISMYWMFGVILGYVPPGVGPHNFIGALIFLLSKFVSLVLLGLMISIIGQLTSHLLLEETGKKKESSLV